jgi:hypothetical protein
VVTVVVNKQLFNESINKDMELDFIEKELTVMTDKELIGYYQENYLDSNITRLIRIEHKKRHGAADGAVYMPLHEFGVEDEVTKQIDEEIKRTIGMRSVTCSMCSFVGALDVTGTPVPKLISWGTLFDQGEQRNKSSFTKVRLVDLYNSNIYWGS